MWDSLILSLTPPSQRSCSYTDRHAFVDYKKLGSFKILRSKITASSVETLDRYQIGLVHIFRMWCKHQTYHIALMCWFENHLGKVKLIHDVNHFLIYRSWILRICADGPILPIDLWEFWIAPRITCFSCKPLSCLTLFTNSWSCSKWSVGDLSGR